MTISRGATHFLTNANLRNMNARKEATSTHFLPPLESGKATEEMMMRSRHSLASIDGGNSELQDYDDLSRELMGTESDEVFVHSVCSSFSVLYRRASLI